MIDIHHLKALQAIAETGSLSAAAQQLHCTQSALSHLLKKLEQQLDVTLVERSRRPTQLNQAGQYLAREGQSILKSIDDLEQDLQAMRSGQQGRLFICLECHTCIEWLSPILDTYRKKYPAVELDLRMGASFDPLPALEAQSMDLLITAERNKAKGIIGDRLFGYEIVAVLSPDHPLAEKEYLRAKDFAGQTVITYPVSECRLDLYTRFLEPAGVVPAHRRTAELTTVIIQWVASGLGIAALPAWALQDVQQDLVTIPLGKKTLQAELYALRRAGDKTLAHLDAFVELIRKQHR